MLTDDADYRIMVAWPEIYPATANRNRITKPDSPDYDGPLRYQPARALRMPGVRQIRPDGRAEAGATIALAMENPMSSYPIQPRVLQPEAQHPRSRHLIRPLGRLGIRATKLLLAHAPRLAIVLLSRSLGAAFDQQVLRWIAAGAGIVTGLW